MYGSVAYSLYYTPPPSKKKKQIGDENNPSGAVEEILSQPDKLSDLDLDAFAEELERQDYGNKKITLYDIRNELFAPFKERRAAYSPMTEVNTHSVGCVFIQLLKLHISKFL